MEINCSLASFIKVQWCVIILHIHLGYLLPGCGGNVCCFFLQFNVGWSFFPQSSPLRSRRLQMARMWSSLRRFSFVFEVRNVCFMLQFSFGFSFPIRQCPWDHYGLNINYNSTSNSCGSYYLSTPNFEHISLGFLISTHNLHARHLRSRKDQPIQILVTVCSFTFFPISPPGSFDIFFPVMGAWFLRGSLVGSLSVGWALVVGVRWDLSGVVFHRILYCLR